MLLHIRPPHFNKGGLIFTVALFRLPPQEEAVNEVD